MSRLDPTGEPPHAPDVGVSSTVQSCVSLAILIHAACVGILLWASYSPSAVQLRLTELFAPYVGLLAVDPMGKELFLTHGDIDDVDLRIEWRPSGAADDTPWEVAIPEASNRIGFERRRQQRLAWEIASRFLEEGDERSAAEGGRLISDVGRWLAFGRELKPGEIRVRRHSLQSPEAVGSTDPADRDPSSDVYFDTVYRASVVVEGETVRIVRRTVAAQEAPSRRRTPQPRGRTP